MNQSIINILITSLSLLMIACNSPKNESRVSKLPYYQDPSFTPHWINDDSDRLKTFHKISPFNMINQNGDHVSNDTFDGKIYVTNFFFTSCPGICPKMSNSMNVIQKHFFKDDKVLLLSYSVTPVKDSVPILKLYAEEYNVITNKWHLVTGDQKEIYQLGRNDYFIEEDFGQEKNDEDFLHTENFVLIDQKGYIRGIYNGTNNTSVQQLIKDIKTLKK